MNVAAGVNLKGLRKLRVLQPQGEIAAMLGIFAALRVIEVLRVAAVSYPDTVTDLDLNFIGDAKRLWTVPLIWTIVLCDTWRELIQLLLGLVHGRRSRSPSPTRAGTWLRRSAWG